MTRWKAAAIHLSISAVIGCTALLLFLFIWYPPPYFGAAGADELTLLLVCVDLCIGPLLTLIVFRSGKWGLKFDLAAIAVAQLSALVYGCHVVLESRPVFLVGVLDRFVLVSANEISDADLADGQQPRFRKRSWTGPKLVIAEQPATEKERSDLAFSALDGRDLQNLPKYYRDFEPLGAQLLKRAKPLSSLYQKDSESAPLVKKTLGDRHLSESNVRWLPLEARKRDMVMLVDATTADPVGALPIDPW
jgi:hypothetical protein